MVDLTQFHQSTLEACDRAFEKHGNAELPRPYLGASSIGDPCSKKLWLRFRWVREIFDAQTLKRFRDGHITEATVIAQLKLNPDIKFYSGDGDQQIGFTDIDGHFSGHLDGEIEGLKESSVRHVAEIKATSDKKFNELKKHKLELGEKLALRKWNEIYYAQIVLYMFYRKLKRAMHVVATAGARDWVSVRTNEDNTLAKSLIEKARRIIYSPDAPTGLPRDSSNCKYCGLFDVCQNKKLPERNCRTCIHSSPLPTGNAEWSCARTGGKLTYDQQLSGCTAHLFIPSFVNGSVVDTNGDENTIAYKMKDGREWTDGQHV